MGTGVKEGSRVAVKTGPLLSTLGWLVDITSLHLASTAISFQYVGGIESAHSAEDVA